VAKSRSRSATKKKKVAPKRRPKKAAPRRATTRGVTARGAAAEPLPPVRNVIELRPIRLQLQRDVVTLGAAIGTRAEAQPKLEEALKRLSRWLDDIQEICGPDMSIPIPPLP
jgi:hypothetical protein